MDETAQFPAIAWGMDNPIDPNSQPPPAPAPVAPDPVPEPAPPEAAVVVKEGKSPRELELEAKLEEESRLRKGHELTIAQLKEDTHKLREVTRAAPRKKKGCLEAFLEGEA